MNDTKLKEIERITSSNEFWALSSGDHLNMIDSLLEHTEELKAEVERQGKHILGLKLELEAFREDDKSLHAEVDRYRTALEELRRITPYGMYHEMIDKILEADKG